MAFIACVYFAVILCVVVVFGAPSPATRDSDNEACQPDKLTVYKVVLHTFWSREKFPKHYPDWRPSAQWSKVFGEFDIKKTLLKTPWMRRTNLKINNLIGKTKYIRNYNY